MAKKKTPAERFRERLDGLSAAIPEDLRLPSLEENRLEADMTPIHLTEEQSQAIACSGEQPPVAIDPRTNTAYVLLRADSNAPTLSQPEQRSPLASGPRAPIAPLMLRSQQAFWRDLPELLGLRSKRCRWVAYHGDERIGFGKTQTELYQMCFRRGLPRGEFYVGKIEAEEIPPWGTFQADWSLHETTEENEAAVPPGAV